MSRTSVSAAESAIEPRQPSRLEKKKNTDSREVYGAVGGLLRRDRALATSDLTRSWFSGLRAASIAFLATPALSALPKIPTM